MGDNQSENGKVQEAEVLSEAQGSVAEDGKLVLARQVYPTVLPVLPMNQRPVFPRLSIPVLVEAEALRRMLMDAVEKKQKFVALILGKELPGEENGGPVTSERLHRVGVVAEIVQVMQAEHEGPMQVLLSALERFRVLEVVQESPHVVVKVHYVLDGEVANSMEVRAYSLSVIKSIRELIELNPLQKQELNLLMSRSNIQEPGRLADFAAALTTATPVELQDILETLNIRERLGKVLTLLKKEIDVSRLQVKINKRIEEKLSKQQREFFLREQLKAIKKELGLSKEGKEAEVERFEERLKHLKLTGEAKERIEEELEKLRLLEPASPEFSVSRTYLDWLTVLPWGVFTKDSYDIAKARRILNSDHYGLDDVKSRILEFLSVGILKGNIAGSILCFVGPPGVGKTSVGQSIARSIGRNFYRFSVGGIHDEAEIKGHRRTYIGALPGKFVQAIKTCKSANPVIMLDEIDKIGASYRGDPASALLEVLDPEQNRDFLDHYLDVRFDLSNVFFICTANQQDTIPRPLLDRMEVIPIAGYILREKVEIAKRYLVPRQAEMHGIQSDQVRVSTDGLHEIIDGYAREPGVRSLEKAVRKIMRKSAMRIVSGEKKKAVVKAGNVADYLGKRVFTDEQLYKKPIPGVVIGLAWTSLGGDTLNIEATRIDADKAGFKQTGQLGSVMIESSEIAYTYVQALLVGDESAREFFRRHMIHLHVPAGATPKDGPSAGITMASALYSLVKGKPVRPGFAMTGELTLTGRVMPIGGVKEKTIAARRAKLKNLVFPAQNRKDFEELPLHVRQGLNVHYVESFSDVVAVCFPAAGGKRSVARRPGKPRRGA